MISGGFNNENNNKNGGSPNLSPIKKLFHTLKNGGKKALRRGVFGAFDGGKRFLKLGVLFLVTVLLFTIFVSSCSFLFSGEQSGKSGSYVDYDNTSNEDGINYSPANASCKAYYQLLTKNKSVWQESLDDNGNKILILSSDSKAKSDYFQHDKNYYIEPDLLFVMNEEIFGEDYVYPEAFLNPVNYNKDTYKLEPLVDDKNNVIVKSISPDGEEKYNVADYGIATVMTYKEVTKSTYEKKIIYKEDYLDASTGFVLQRELDEPKVEITSISSTNYDVLDRVVTYNSEEIYKYENTSYKSSELLAPETESDTDSEVDIYKRLKETKVVNTYYARANFTSYAPYRYDTNLASLQAYCDAHNYSIVCDSNGNPLFTSQEYDLYEYFSDDSGVYTDFVNYKGVDKEDLGYEYLYDYLEHFATYKPHLERTYDTFKYFSSGASLNNYSSALLSSDATLGEGENDFERFYNGSKKEIIDRIYDGLIQWGYTELQASAMIGNICKESGFNQSALNPDSSAFGLCQWTNARQSKLQSFASGYNNTDKTDLNSQIQFLCMELDSKKTYAYASCQWGTYPSYKLMWETSNDIDELTEAVAIGWERYATPDELRASVNHQNDLKLRQAYSRSAYKLLSGKNVEYPIAIIDCYSSSGGMVSQTVSTTSSMSEKDRKAFNDFYYATDNWKENNISYEYFTLTKGEGDVDYILAVTNSYINQTLLSEETSKSREELTHNGFFTDLSIKKTRNLISGGEYASLVMELGQMHVGEGGGFVWAIFGATDEWCGMFVWAMFKETDMLYAISDEDSNRIGEGCSSSYALAGAYLEWALLEPSSRIVYYNQQGNDGYLDGEYGDIVVFDYEPNGTINHVGFILSNEGNGQYITLEGNHSDRVEIVDRRVSTNEIVAIIRPAYHSKPTSNN